MTTHAQTTQKTECFWHHTIADRGIKISFPKNVQCFSMKHLSNTHLGQIKHLIIHGFTIKTIYYDNYQNIQPRFFGETRNYYTTLFLNS